MTSTVKVRDRPVRSFGGACGRVVSYWLTADEFDNLCEVAGFATAGRIDLRLVFGMASRRYTRFSQFICFCSDANAALYR